MFVVKIYMEISIKRPSKSKVEINIELSAESFDRYYEKALSELKQEVQVKGFRQGKVPNEIAEKQMGQDKILNHAAQIAIKEKYVEAIRENNLEVIDRPRVDILKLALKNPFKFKIEATILPEIELPGYKEIASEVKSKPELVKEEEIEQTLEWVQKSRSSLSDLNREAKKEDFVKIEYSSSQIEGGAKKKDGFILGKGHFIPGFEKEIEGMKTGEEKEFSLKIPKDFSLKGLAGKDVDFKVKIEGVSKVEVPELNDEFAKSLGNFKNMDEVRKNIEEGLSLEKERKEKEKLRGEIIDKIIKKIKWDIPDSLAEAEKKRLFNEFKESFSRNPQSSFEDYLEKAKKSEKEVENSFYEAAERNVKTYLTLKEISKKEKIEVSDEEIAEGINQILEANLNIKKEDLDFERMKHYTKERLINEKVFQLLEKQSKKL